MLVLEISHLFFARLCDCVVRFFFGVFVHCVCTGQFTALMTIGTQTLHVLVDTGSTTLAVAGSSCTSCGNLSPKYIPGWHTRFLARNASLQFFFLLCRVLVHPLHPY